MLLFKKILTGEEKIALVGLGYVGMPIAVAFAKKVNVIGYDLNAKKIELYKNNQKINIDKNKVIFDKDNLVIIKSELDYEIKLNFLNFYVFRN